MSEPPVAADPSRSRSKASAAMAAAAAAAAPHLPVLLGPVLTLLAPERGGLFVDCTFGAGGYTRAILEASPDTRVLAIDRDPAMLEHAKPLMQRFRGRLALTRSLFSHLPVLMRNEPEAAGIVADLGVSSMQLDQGERGFSFRFDGPLDMRMDPLTATPTAADLVNTLPEKELADLLFDLGEERKARQIARRIIAERVQTPIRTTQDLARIIRAVVRPSGDGIDPATRSFQALRLAVNQELQELDRLLEVAPPLLAPDGRFVVVSFHSLEDRRVKHAFREAAGRRPQASRHLPPDPFAETQSRFRLLTPKPVSPDGAEAAANPRARSAHARALIRPVAPFDPKAEKKGPP